MAGTSFQGVPAKPIVAMKLSTESIVAVAVAVVFVVLTLGAVAREQGEHGIAIMSQTSLQGSEISLSWNNGRGENQPLARY
jgi:hypothetical protein